MQNKKEKNSQMNLKNQEVSKMSKVPYTKQQLLKWSCFRIEKGADYKQAFKLIHTPLTELVKKPGYEHFKNKLNWLYNNYSVENYQLVWSELQDYNERRKIAFIQAQVIAKADYILNKQIEEHKTLFGDIPAWIDKLNDKQRDLLLARAKTCYGLVPQEIELETKQVYTVPERIVKEYRDDGSVIYYSNEELRKAHIRPAYFNDVVGRVKVKSAELQRLAENAVIRDAKWLSQFNDTEFDMREKREVEGDEHGNKMVPITDLQGDDSPYGLDIEFRDFLEPIYGEDESF